MSSAFLTEPVALWEYLSLHTNTTTKHPHTPNSSQTVTASSFFFSKTILRELSTLTRQKHHHLTIMY